MPGTHMKRNAAKPSSILRCTVVNVHLPFQLAKQRHCVVALVVAKLWIAGLCDDGHNASAWVSLFEGCAEERP